MIPKKIHYCWFGRNPLPESAQKCIASWRKFLPDYEIIEWNEDNFDVNCIPYTKEAYEAKKYAFVCDYAYLLRQVCPTRSFGLNKNQTSALNGCCHVRIMKKIIDIREKKSNFVYRHGFELVLGDT